MIEIKDHNFEFEKYIKIVLFQLWHFENNVESFQYDNKAL